MLKAMGLPLHDTQNALRLSLGRHTTRGQVDRLIAALPSITARLRALTDRRPASAAADRRPA
ncbi:MAG: hypothetical protein H0V80_03390 [Acidobacteria bacterium]|nr:hypothetical protein [Acidobacteriota bacterium]